MNVNTLNLVNVAMYLRMCVSAHVHRVCVCVCVCMCVCVVCVCVCTHACVRDVMATQCQCAGPIILSTTMLQFCPLCS